LLVSALVRVSAIAFHCVCVWVYPMVLPNGGMFGEWSTILSPRERDVALPVARGLANKEIARELTLSHGTVKLHVYNIFIKLGARKRQMLFYVINGS
jgi:DNA-binding NarL/FixJ family response regulator